MYMQMKLFKNYFRPKYLTFKVYYLLVKIKIIGDSVKRVSLKIIIASLLKMRSNSNWIL